MRKWHTMSKWPNNQLHLQPSDHLMALSRTADIEESAWPVSALEHLSSDLWLIIISSVVHIKGSSRGNVLGWCRPGTKLISWVAAPPPAQRWSTAAQLLLHQRSSGHLSLTSQSVCCLRLLNGQPCQWNLNVCKWVSGPPKRSFFWPRVLTHVLSLSVYTKRGNYK